MSPSSVIWKLLRIHWIEPLVAVPGARVNSTLYSNVPSLHDPR